MSSSDYFNCGDWRDEYDRRTRKDRPWNEYPVGTKAFAIMGGHWYRVEHGWKWNGPDGSGGVFPTPGGDNNGWVLTPEAPSAGMAGHGSEEKGRDDLHVADSEESGAREERQSDQVGGGS